ncbi:MAG: hypothetical protein QOJ44_243 [Acidimicrobiaceae bacterium]|nr:hypothetical protein [Acidimicrobiaceae bacterium]
MSPPIAIVAGTGGELGQAVVVSLVVVPLDDRAIRLMSQL